jgi:hypothetical protein
MKWANIVKTIVIGSFLMLVTIGVVAPDFLFYMLGVFLAELIMVAIAVQIKTRAPILSTEHDADYYFGVGSGYTATGFGEINQNLQLLNQRLQRLEQERQLERVS